MTPPFTREASQPEVGRRLGVLAYVFVDSFVHSSKKFKCIEHLSFPHTVPMEGKRMRDKREENGAAQMAWQLFEKTGSISYYMLYYDILRKK